MTTTYNKRKTITPRAHTLRKDGANDGKIRWRAVPWKKSDEAIALMLGVLPETVGYRRKLQYAAWRSMKWGKWRKGERRLSGYPPVRIYPQEVLWWKSWNARTDYGEHSPTDIFNK